MNVTDQQFAKIYTHYSLILWCTEQFKYIHMLLHSSEGQIAVYVAGLFSVSDSHFVDGVLFSSVDSSLFVG